MKIMTIDRRTITTIGDVWPYLVTRPSFRNLKPKLGRKYATEQELEWAKQSLQWKQTPIPTNPTSLI